MQLWLGKLLRPCSINWQSEETEGRDQVCHSTQLVAVFKVALVFQEKPLKQSLCQSVISM